ncbi:MAG: hypothetical protein CMI00_13750 [Oceanospirillaceae bacterium]|nr:hypothetical protein [Oceanospirillaceae bacterium]|tara:strand:- start:2708 stop:3025 length:318 start_codon:yes stop_codon:yes gene_type:complete
MKTDQITATEYQPENADEAYKMTVLMGYTDQELADYFHVSAATLSRWRLEQPEFDQAISIARQVVSLNGPHCSHLLTPYPVDVMSAKNYLRSKIRSVPSTNPGAN